MRLGTIQVDLDGLWTILDYYGKKHPLDDDPIYETAIPKFINLFKKHNVKATFFVIGKDLEVPKKRKLIEQLVQEGHEIANHTYSHKFGFRKLKKEEKVAEIKKAEELISQVTGKKTFGFKTPGYDIDKQSLQILNDCKYSYDSSILPSFAYPPLQIINSIVNRKKIRSHGPKIRWGLAPNRPYFPSQKCIWRKRSWKKESSGLLEIPCTVMPYLRLPFQTAFIFLAGINYFKFSYFLVKNSSRFPINYTFHAIDLADDFDNREFNSNIPSTQNIKLRKREKICEQIIRKISKDYKIITTKELVDVWITQKGKK